MTKCINDELIDIYDKNNEPLGISKMKSEAHEKGLWHRAAHVWIYNSKGNILFQLRTACKKFYPNMWTPSSAGGHIGAGENEIDAIIRETEEEIGLSVKEIDLSFAKIMKEERVYKKIINNEFHYIYLYKFDGDINNLKLQEAEVQKVEWFSINKINQGLESHSEKYLIEKSYWQKVSTEIKKRIK